MNKLRAYGSVVVVKHAATVSGIFRFLPIAVCDLWRNR